MSDKEEDSASNEGLSLEQSVLLLKRQHLRHIIGASLLLVLSAGLLIGSVVAITQLFEPLGKIKKQNPEYKFKLLRYELKQQNDDLQEYFERYKKFSDDGDVGNVIKNAKIFSGALIESEQDMQTAIEAYRAAIFNIASNIRGSGESHRFYRMLLREHITQFKFRVAELEKIERQ